MPFTVEQIGQWRASLQHALNETRRQYALVERLPNDPDVRAKANFEAENLERLRVAALAEYNAAIIPSVAVENAADELVTDLAICETALQEEFFVLVENDEESATAPEQQTTPGRQAALAAPENQGTPKSSNTTHARTPPAGTKSGGEETPTGETTIDEYVILSGPAAATAASTAATVPALTLRRRARREATPRHPPPTATPRRLPPTPENDSSSAAATPAATTETSDAAAPTSAEAPESTTTPKRMTTPEAPGVNTTAAGGDSASLLRRTRVVQRFLSSTKIDGPQMPGTTQTTPDGTMLLDDVEAADSASVASRKSGGSGRSSKSAISEQIARDRDEDLERERKKMEARRASSQAEIAMLNQKLQEAYQNNQTQELLYQSKQEKIWRGAEEQMDEVDGELSEQEPGLEFTAAGLGIGGATPGDKARDWLNKVWRRRDSAAEARTDIGQRPNMTRYPLFRRVNKQTRRLGNGQSWF